MHSSRHRKTSRPQNGRAPNHQQNNPKKPQKGVVFEARLSQNGYGAVSTHLGNSGLSDTRLREDVACQILFDVSTMYTSSDMQHNLYNFGMGMSRPLLPLSPEASASSVSLSVHTEDGPSHNIGSSQNITVQIERGPGLPQSPRGRVWPGSGPKSTICRPPPRNQTNNKKHIYIYIHIYGTFT